MGGNLPSIDSRIVLAKLGKSSLLLLSIIISFFVFAQHFVTANPLTAEKNDIATTGAFVPFGSPTNPGQVIPGNTENKPGL